MKFSATSRSEVSSPNQFKKRCRKEAMVIKLSLDQEFEKIMRARAKQKPDLEERMKRKKELSKLGDSNRKKLKVLEGLQKEIELLRSRVLIVNEKEDQGIEELNGKLIQVDLLFENEGFETKKLEKMKAKLEGDNKELYSNVSIMKKEVEKIENKAKILSINKFSFKNYASLALNEAFNYQTVKSNYKDEFDYKCIELKSELEGVKSNTMNIYSRMAENDIEVKEKLKEKSGLLQIISRHTQESSKLIDKDLIQEKLEQFHGYFSKIKRIMKQEFDGDINLFTSEAIEWMKKAEFKQISLTMHFQENVRCLLEKKQSLQELKQEKIELTNLNSTKNHIKPSQNSPELLNKEVNLSEKIALNSFYSLFSIVKNLKLAFTTLENNMLSKDSRFSGLKFRIDEFLQQINLIKDKTMRTLNKQENNNFRKFLLEVEMKNNHGFNSIILKHILTEEIIERVSMNGLGPMEDIPFFTYIKFCHKFMRKAFKIGLKTFSEFILMLISSSSEAKSNMELLSVNTSKNPLKMLSRLKSLLESKPRTSFYIREQPTSPLGKNECSSLEAILLKGKLPDVKTKERHKTVSEENIQKLKTGNKELDGKIRILNVQKLQMSKALMGGRSLVRFPQKFLVKNEFVKRLYDGSKSISSTRLNSKTTTS